jgi:ribonuclease HII
VFVVGVDENGLGPRLGPLVATAVTLELSEYRREPLRRLGERLDIRDSKASSGFGRMAAVEGVSLALMERLHGKRPGDADAFLKLVSIDGPERLRQACPAGSAPQCWSVPVELPAFGGDPDAGHRALDGLSTGGVAVRSARSAVACAGTLNREIKRLGSKLTVDLMMFERLVVDARAGSGGEVEAVCGMVGGIRNYPGYFQVFDGSGVEEIERVRGRSAYRVEGVGRVAFEVDSDARHLPVALASMVGKYLREICMERQNRFYLGRQPSLTRVSGYRDRLTAGFVEQSAALRRRLGIADSCFER